MHGFHPGCSHLKLNHLAFADDLLMFCKGNVASVVLLLRGFASFYFNAELPIAGITLDGLVKEPGFLA